MSYKYSFDTRSVGDAWFWKESFEFYHNGLIRLRELLDAWNTSEKAPPYVDEVRDLTQGSEGGSPKEFPPSDPSPAGRGAA